MPKNKKTPAKEVAKVLSKSIIVKLPIGEVLIENEDQLNHLRESVKLNEREYKYYFYNIVQGINKKQSALKAGYPKGMAKNTQKIEASIAKKVGEGWLKEKKMERANDMYEAFANEGLDFGLVAKRIKGMIDREEFITVEGREGQVQLVGVPHIASVNIALTQWAKLTGAYKPEQTEIIEKRNIGYELDKLETQNGQTTVG